MVAIALKF